MSSRIAVCVSGQVRTLHSCNFGLLDLISKISDADVFVHTWKESGGANSFSVTSENFSSFKNLLALQIEEQPKNISNVFRGVTAPKSLKADEPIHYRGTLPLYYSMRRSFELLEQWEQKQNVTYDIVIKMRFDCDFLGFTFRAPKRLSSNTIYGERCLIDARYQFSDKFAFGSRRAMEIYMKGFDAIEGAWSEYTEGSPWCGRPVGERLMRRHLVESGCELKYTNVVFFLRRVKGYSKAEAWFEYGKGFYRVLKNIILQKK